MASSGTYTYGTSPTKSSPRTPRRPSVQRDLKEVEDHEVVQGRIFWLPPKEELPSRAVRRAHGKGAIEEGIYNHPVVVISRPSEESQIVHCHVITSFQGKRLHEIYSKSNEFHASRRSWYLPISPSPTHPDAKSKKTQKRFPTLDLASGALLRWDSYVNLRHVYKIEWSYLKPYSNPDTPERNVFRLDRESMIRLLSKSRTLTNYEPGTQLQTRRTRSLPLEIPDRETQKQLEEHDTRRSLSDASSVISSEYSGLSPILQSDFGSAAYNDPRNIRRPPKAPPDRRKGRRWRRLWRLVWLVLTWPLVLARWVRNRIRS